MTVGVINIFTYLFSIENSNYKNVFLAVGACTYKLMAQERQLDKMFIDTRKFKVTVLSSMLLLLLFRFEQG